MADLPQTIPEYPELITVTDNDELVIVDKSDVTESLEGSTKRISRGNLTETQYGLLQSTETASVSIVTPSGVDVLLEPTVGLSTNTSTSLYDASSDGAITYNGAGLKAKIVCSAAFDNSSGTTGITVKLFRNDVEFAELSGLNELTVDTSTYLTFGDLDLATDDIITAKVQISTSTTIRLRAFYIKIEKR